MVVGAGLGGLATALRLSHLGYRVTVLERLSSVGGRNQELTVGECHFDSGPTLLMMLEPFRKLFEDVGERLEDHLQLARCEPSYRVFYADHTCLDASSDFEKLREAVAAVNPQDAATLHRFRSDLAGLYEAAIPMFVERNYDSLADFLGPTALKTTIQHKMLSNLHKRIRSYFQDERVQMLFSFQSMYLGLSPFAAAWVYSTLTYMEMAGGIWYPMGGVTQLSYAIQRLAEQHGATIRTGCEVTKIEANSVHLSSGEVIKADAIVSNVDLPKSKSDLEGEKIPASWKYSCSAYMLYLDYEGELPTLLHHNVFFGRDFRRNFDQIFNLNQIPEDPSFYVCVSGKSDPSRTRPGHQNLMILVPCPNLDHAWLGSDGEGLQASVFDRLSRECGFQERKVRALKVRTPVDWQNDFMLEKGAAFGLSHHLLQSAYFRPSNRSKSNPFLYYVGASTVPGNGMPMVLISADLAVQHITNRFS